MVIRVKACVKGILRMRKGIPRHFAHASRFCVVIYVKQLRNEVIKATLFPILFPSTALFLYRLLLFYSASWQIFSSTPVNFHQQNVQLPLISLIFFNHLCVCHMASYIVINIQQDKPSLFCLCYRMICAGGRKNLLYCNSGRVSSADLKYPASPGKTHLH